MTAPPPPSDSSAYVHGYSPAEQQRLTRLQGLLNDAQLAAMDLSGVRSIVDFGAGLGQMTRALARRVGRGARVVGVERDARQIAEAERQAAADGEAGLVELRQGAVDAPPLAEDEVGTFDLAHGRFILEHVRNPLDVAKHMVESVRPGGRIVLVDDDHELLRFEPEVPQLADLWRRFWVDFESHGLDPLIGRRLPRLLVDAGARVTRSTTFFFGATQGAPTFDTIVDNFLEVMGASREDMVARGVVTGAAWDAAETAAAAWRTVPGASIWYSIPLVEGVRP